MTVGPLPLLIRQTGAVITQSIEVPRTIMLARHKTLNYWRKANRPCRAQSRPGPTRFYA